MSGISIKDPETERLIRLYARRTGQSLTAAVRDAARRALTTIEPPSVSESDSPAEAKAQRIKAILKRMDALPRTGKLLTDDDLYDELGLPR